LASEVHQRGGSEFICAPGKAGLASLWGRQQFARIKR
jgi:hypothetical protein